MVVQLMLRFTATCLLALVLPLAAADGGGVAVIDEMWVQAAEDDCESMLITLGFELDRVVRPELRHLFAAVAAYGEDVPERVHVGGRDWLRDELEAGAAQALAELLAEGKERNPRGVERFKRSMKRSPVIAALLPDAEPKRLASEDEIRMAQQLLRERAILAQLREVPDTSKTLRQHLIAQGVPPERLDEVSIEQGMLTLVLSVIADSAPGKQVRAEAKRLGVDLNGVMRQVQMGVPGIRWLAGPVELRAFLTGPDDPALLAEACGEPISAWLESGDSGGERMAALLSRGIEAHIDAVLWAAVDQQVGVERALPVLADRGGFDPAVLSRYLQRMDSAGREPDAACAEIITSASQLAPKPVLELLERSIREEWSCGPLDGARLGSLLLERGPEMSAFRGRVLTSTAVDEALVTLALESMALDVGGSEAGDRDLIRILATGSPYEQRLAEQFAFSGKVFHDLVLPRLMRLAEGEQALQKALAAFAERVPRRQ